MFIYAISTAVLATSSTVIASAPRIDTAAVADIGQSGWAIDVLGNNYIRPCRSC